jgi:hypothetical protein
MVSRFSSVFIGFLWDDVSLVLMSRLNTSRAKPAMDGWRIGLQFARTLSASGSPSQAVVATPPRRRASAETSADAPTERGGYSSVPL